MSPASRFRGVPVSEGVAAGNLYQAEPADDGGAATEAGLRAAFAGVARDRDALARRLREDGRHAEADIVAIGALIAADAALIEPAIAAVAAGASAVSAIQRSAAAQAAALAALPAPDLAERASDVRQIASAVAGRLSSGAVPPPPPGRFILVRGDVDPADLIRLAGEGLAGAVSVHGGATSHAAIIARSLGVPMLAGADPGVLAAPAGHPALLDTRAGELILNPPEAELAAASSHGLAPLTRSAPPPPPRTRDGQEVTVLCNVASGAETRLGLAAGAAGVGLLRTEIPFVRAGGWPTEEEHRRWLDPVLSQLAGRPAVVRLLDYSGDKVPPFLAGGEPGLAALLHDPYALRDQLRAVLLAGAACRLAVIVPMVSTLDQVREVRVALAEAAARTGSPMPPLGIMVEIAATAEAAAEFAPEVDFFSVGTNDLTSQVLGLDRSDPRSAPALAADPRVLGLVAAVVDAADRRRIGVSVCGDAAADPAVLPPLIGLGIRSFSVGAARVADVAGWIADTDTGAAASLAEQALADRAKDKP